MCRTVDRSTRAPYSDSSTYHRPQVQPSPGIFLRFRVHGVVCNQSFAELVKKMVKLTGLEPLVQGYRR